MPNWRPLNRGFSLSRSIDRSQKVELWYADDLPLIDNAAPNKAAVFASFGLPPRSAPSDDPDLPGAIVIDHQMVGPAVVLPGATVARATVAVIYDSHIRFRLEPRLTFGVVPTDGVKFNIPLVKLRAIPSGSAVVASNADAKRMHRRRWVKVRTSGNADALANTIEAQCDRRYTFGGVHYLLETYGIASRGNGEIEITYWFRTTGRVRAVGTDTFGGENVALPALANLDEYAVDLQNGTVSVKSGTDLYEAGTTLPGGVG
jgi:hypothetical protein